MRFLSPNAAFVLASLLCPPLVVLGGFPRGLPVRIASIDRPTSIPRLVLRPGGSGGSRISGVKRRPLDNAHEAEIVVKCESRGGKTGRERGRAEGGRTFHEFLSNRGSTADSPRAGLYANHARLSVNIRGYPRTCATGRPRREFLLRPGHRRVVIYAAD